ncbi:MAG: gas vesicle protein [Deltaproteobacteria bacterium]|nr:gas vesicle protein [Deltaproteobacteria bacterium]
MAIGMMGLIDKARSDLSKLTGLDPSSLVTTAKTDDGWQVAIEMVEKRSIPDGMDLLATYEVKLDEQGNILEFIRKGMRKRMEAASEVR